MKIQLLRLIFITTTLIGCAPVQNHALPPPTQLSSPTNISTPVKVLPLTSTFTPTPSPNVTTTLTPTITPQTGHRVWSQGSLLEYYAIQYREDDWTERDNSLTHKRLQGCLLGTGGGSDICMSGGCVTSNVVLGKIEFGRTVVSNTTAIYSSYPINIHLLYQAWLGENPEKCIQQVESVLGTIKLRPERSCTDHATFVEDITIQDNATITSGSSFTKTWRIKNTGSCPWTRDYSLYLVGIIPSADAYQQVYLQNDVHPGQIIDISVELTAPPTQGVIRWEWMLRNEIGDLFGVGDAPYNPFPGTPFWVQINVVPSQNP